MIFDKFENVLGRKLRSQLSLIFTDVCWTKVYFQWYNKHDNIVSFLTNNPLPDTACTRSLLVVCEADTSYTLSAGELWSWYLVHTLSAGEL